MRRSRIVGVAGVLLLTVAGVGQATAAPQPRSGAPGPDRPAALAWHPCAGEGWPADARCATLRVPLDYRAPDGPTIGIAVSKVPAADPERRRGVLVTNPGGPGTPGLRSAVEFADVASPRVRSAFDRYDLVSFDPRGVGRSAPVSCGLRKGQVVQLRAALPKRAGKSGSAGLAAATARACATSADPVLRTVSTANTARDLDRLRQALGAPRISYYGNSYGTYLGVVYSTLFGAHTDRVVLDSMVDSERGWYHQNRLIARATEKRFDDFAAWRVGEGDAESVADVRQRYLRLAAKLERAPARAGEFTVDGQLLRRMTYASVGNNERFPALASSLDCLGRADGDPCRDRLAATLRALLNSPDLTDDASASAFLAVQCNDSAAPRALASYRNAVAEDARRYPISGGGFADVPPCAFWPYAAGPMVRATDRGPHNILMLNNTRDRISDLGGARSTRRALGERARFVAVEGWNHNILSNDNACADAHVARWLGAGKRPHTDQFCPG